MQQPGNARDDGAAQAPPLSGIRVLDLSRVLAGPWCTQTLADLGADVWKVEPPGAGDDTRSWLAAALDGRSTYFMSANRSKRSLAVDLRRPSGRAVVRALAMKADILVENFKLGGLDRFGLGYQDLSTENPCLVYCSISGYGRTGSRAAEAGYDFVMQAESGLMAITGEPDGEPMRLGVAITDIATGMNAVQAILAALIARGRTGRGQFIDMALHDTGVTLLANIGQGALATGQHPGRFGNAHATIVPYQTFQASDKTFVLAIGNDLQFRRLCERVLYRPELAREPAYASNRLRVENRERLVAELAAIFKTLPAAEWLARLRQAGVPGGSVREVLDVLASPEVAERGLFATVESELHGSLPLMASPLKLRGTPVLPPRHPPSVGEHTAEILSDVLDMTETEIAAFVSEHQE